MWSKVWTLSLFLLLGCSTAELGKGPLSPMLFPTGQYQQDVRVDILLPPAARNFDFSCVVVRTEDRLRLVGYSSFGLSLFKIEQKNDEPIVAETSIEEISKNKDFFIRIFKLVKRIMSLQRLDSQIKDQKIHLQEADISSDVQFSEWDKAGIPRRMKLESQAQYLVTVETTSYRLDPAQAGAKPETDHR